MTRTLLYIDQFKFLIRIELQMLAIKLQIQKLFNMCLGCCGKA